MQKKIMVVANWDWVLYNFRLPLIRSLEEKGLKVILVCPEGKYVERLRADGFNWLPWNMDRQSKSPIKELTALLDLVRLYKGNNPDAVHHITIKAIFYGSIAARLGNVVVVINNFTGLGYLFSESRKAKWLRGITLPILRWAVNGQGYYTVLLNKMDRQKLLSENLITKEYSRIIPGDGVDLERFYPEKPVSTNQGKTIILMAARLLWDKGVAEFIEAAISVQKEEKQTQFWLAGKPDPGNPTSVPRSIIERWQKEGVVEFLGHCDEMSSILRKADIAVLPSYYEGVPVFLLEAAASGLPLIATDIEGCRMIIEDGKNGYLIPKGNARELASVLLTLIKDPELRQKMGQRSRGIVEENYDKQKIIKQFLSLYRELGVLPG
jgi:glycosyltransferase involved in cell wall biosynthesis